MREEVGLKDSHRTDGIVERFEQKKTQMTQCTNVTRACATLLMILDMLDVKEVIQDGSMIGRR